MDSLTPTQKEEMKRLRATRIQEKLTKKARLNRLKELKEAGKPEHPGLATSLFFKKLNSNKNEVRKESSLESHPTPSPSLG